MTLTFHFHYDQFQKMTMDLHKFLPEHAFFQMLFHLYLLHCSTGKFYLYNCLPCLVYGSIIVVFIKDEMDGLYIYLYRVELLCYCGMSGKIIHFFYSLPYIWLFVMSV